MWLIHAKLNTKNTANRHRGRNRTRRSVGAALTAFLAADPIELGALTRESSIAPRSIKFPAKSR